MKINILKYIGFFVMLAFIVSCDQEAFEEYSRVPAKAAPSLTVTIDSYTDSTMTVTYNLSVAGRVTLAVMPASVDTPSIASMESRTAAGATYIEYYIHDDGNATGTVTFEELLPYTSYRVFGIGHNTDGVVSSLIITDAIRTQDFASPEIVSFTPAKAAVGIAADVLPTIRFSEPVTYVAGKSIVLTSLPAGYSETILAENIVINGNNVSFEHSDFLFNRYVFINIEEGAFIDASGNISPEVYTVNGVQLDWYFKVETDPATQLAKIFENFLGDYVCTDYDNADSVSVDWGPYGVTVIENTDTEEPYDVIIDGFWGWGSGSTFVVTFNTNFTITAQYQKLAVTLDDVFGTGNYGSDEAIWANIWSPDPYLNPIGHWDYTDFSFDFALLFYNNYYGQIYDDLYQEYIKDDGTKSLNTDRPYLPFNK